MQANFVLVDEFLVSRNGPFDFDASSAGFTVLNLLGEIDVGVKVVLRVENPDYPAESRISVAVTRTVDLKKNVRNKLVT